ncbi:cobalamin biosynthesis protein [Embleya sp. NPDC008237]|uniref:cobalamin biosynthesis protein n=1 Tax=Embleya sp. NPDC008237 TaxID=3363978 RepID=UPI0036E3F933
MTGDRVSGGRVIAASAAGVLAPGAAPAAGVPGTQGLDSATSGPASPGPDLVVGVGAARGVGAEEVRASVCAVLARAGLARSAVLALVTVTARANEPGLVAGAALLGLPLFARAAEELAAVPVPHPSERVRAAVGTPGVAEAAARLGPVPGPWLGELLVAKTRGVGARPRCTVAVARHRPAGGGSAGPGPAGAAANTGAEQETP